MTWVEYYRRHMTLARKKTDRSRSPSSRPSPQEKSPDGRHRVGSGPRRVQMRRAVREGQAIIAME